MRVEVFDRFVLFFSDISAVKMTTYVHRIHRKKFAKKKNIKTMKKMTKFSLLSQMQLNLNRIDARHTDDTKQLSFSIKR